MMHTLKLAFVFVLAAGIYSCNGNKAEKEKVSYEKTKESLEEKEKKNPLMFLTVSSKDKHNLIGQTVIRGNVTNNAKVCAYKDVLLEISYYSKTGALLEKANETVYDDLLPGHAASFKLKGFAPRGSDSVAIKILGAKTK